MKPTRIFLGCAILGFAAPGAAQPASVEAQYSPAFNHCMATGDARRGITVAIMSCLGLENDRQDVQLNRAYRLAMARLAPRRRAQLQQSERAWLRTRERTCDAQSGEDDGTAAMMTLSNCFLDETIRRRVWLEHFR